MFAQNGIDELFLTPIDRQIQSYFVKRNQFITQSDELEVYKVGLLQNNNIMIIADESITKRELASLRFELCANLEAIGIKINTAYMIIVNNTEMGDKEYIKEQIFKLPEIKYFLMIGGSGKSYSAVMKSIKDEVDIRGHYKHKNVFGCDKSLLRLCLEINRQCRGINYCCPNNFPTNVAFIHFILTDNQISCCTNATKNYEPHIFIPVEVRGITDYIKILRNILSNISRGPIEKIIDIIIISFENKILHVSSNEVATKMYEETKKRQGQKKIGVAQISFNEDKNMLCRALIFDIVDKEQPEFELDTDKIKEYLKECTKCDDLRLIQNDCSTLPIQIQLADITLTNIQQNFDLPELREKKFFEDYNEPDLNPNPKIKQRNHVITTQDDDAIYKVKEDDDIFNNKYYNTFINY